MSLKRWFDNMRHRFYPGWWFAVAPPPPPFPSPPPPPPPPPPPGITLTYDTRFGTATDSTGWITFGLHPGNRVIYSDSVNGNNANDGLSPATAKASWDAGAALWLGAGWTSSDQFKIAGGQGQTYTDNGAVTWSGKAGISAAYPTLVQSYDSLDPTNTSKCGRLTGAKMPSVKITTGGQTLSAVDAGSSNYFVQGIEFDGQGGGFGINAASFVNPHNYVGFQHCRFKECGVGTTANGGVNSLAFHLSKNAFWGMYCGATTFGGAIGNCQGAYLGGIDGAYVQDNAFIHCGWRIGAARGDSAVSGGPTAFSHGHYYYAANVNGALDRNIYIDSAQDGFNVRGGAAATCIVTLDESRPGAIGGFSGSVSEAPAGVTITVDDWLIMGGELDSNISDSSNGPVTENTLSGSRIKNVAMFDNPSRSSANSTVRPAHTTSIIDQYLLIQDLHAYNYAGGLEISGSAAAVHDTWLNCLVDSLAFTLPSTTLTNTIVHSGLTTYPLAQTRDQVLTTLLSAMGLTPGASYAARKAQLVNILCWRPDLAGQIAAAWQWIGLPTLNLTPTKTPSTSAPNVSAETPRVVY